MYILHCVCSLEPDIGRYCNLSYSLTQPSITALMHLRLASKVTWLFNEAFSGLPCLPSPVEWIPLGTNKMTVLLGYRYSHTVSIGKQKPGLQFCLRTKLLVNIPPKTLTSFGRSKRMCVRVWLEVVQGSIELDERLEIPSAYAKLN